MTEIRSFFLRGKYFRKSYRENQTTHFIFNTFSWKSRRLWHNVDKYATASQATDDSKCCTENMRFFLPDIFSKNTDTLTIFKEYFFPTFIMVMRTHFTVTLYTCLLSHLLVYTKDTALCLWIYNLLGLYNWRSTTVSYLEVKLGLLQEERLREW